MSYFGVFELRAKVVATKRSTTLRTVGAHGLSDPESGRAPRGQP
jgi:hypothetical protein